MPMIAICLSAKGIHCTMDWENNGRLVALSSLLVIAPDSNRLKMHPNQWNLTKVHLRVSMNTQFGSPSFNNARWTDRVAFAPLSVQILVHVLDHTLRVKGCGNSESPYIYIYSFCQGLHWRSKIIVELGRSPPITTPSYCWISWLEIGAELQGIVDVEPTYSVRTTDRRQSGLRVLFRPTCADLVTSSIVLTAASHRSLKGIQRTRNSPEMGLTRDAVRDRSTSFQENLSKMKCVG